LYAELSAANQWYIHDYFQPSIDMPDMELLEHRRHVSAQRPSLAQSAGKACVMLIRYEAAWQEQVRVNQQRQLDRRLRPSNGRVIEVRSVVRPQVDMNKLLKAIRRLAEYEREHGKPYDPSEDQDESKPHRRFLR